jgi:phospholipid/cholesterol/gamma-HCH transport system ATP-binding protein
MIELVNIKKNFEGKEVLKGINAKFEEGICNMVIGGSGSGKTVLMKCLVGLMKPDDGQVMYDGRDFHHMRYGQQRKIRQEIGMLFQYSALFDSMTVEDNVAFPLKLFTKMSKRKIRDRVNFCLDRVNLEKVNNLFPDEISGGMKKRVGIARAIALNPKYLFCDEPNSGLDPLTATVIDELIKEITLEFKMTTVINTHDMNSVFEIGDYVTYLYQGKSHWEGTPEEMKTATDERVKEFIGASEFVKNQHSL